MQQLQLEKATNNRNFKTAALEIRRNANTATNLTELQGSILATDESKNGHRYNYYNDQRLIDRLNVYHKTITAQIKNAIAEIVDDHVKTLDSEFENF